MGFCRTCGKAVGTWNFCQYCGTRLNVLNLTYQNTNSLLRQNVVFNDETLLVMRRQLQSEANRLQDQIDAFNAETKIEFNSPLN